MAAETQNINVIRHFKHFARGTGLSALIIGVLSILGWLVMPEVFSGIVTILGIFQVDTAVAFFLGGCALLLVNSERSNGFSRFLASFFVAVMVLTAIMSLAGYMQNTGKTFAGIVFSMSKISNTSAIYMSPMNTIYFLVLAGGIFSAERKNLIFFSQFFSLIGIILGFSNLIGYTYGLPTLFGIGQHLHADLLSTLLFTILCFGLLFTNPESGAMNIVSSIYTGGAIARKLLPAAVGIPFLLGWIRFLGHKTGFWGIEEGVTIVGLLSIGIFTGIIWWIAGSLNMIDAGRLKAEKDALSANDKLADLVKKLEIQNSKNKIMSEMKDLLLSCASINEISPIIKKFMTDLFPSAEGSLFIFSSSRNILDIISSWGEVNNEGKDLMLMPEDCWAIRRGRPYLAKREENGLVCSHIQEKNWKRSLCIPPTAHGDLFGMLNLRFKAPDKLAGEEIPDNFQETSRFASMAAEQLALSLANLKLKESLKNQSIRDPLTGLFNRRYMEETLLREISRAARKNTHIGILMIDIDHFKKLNDSFGHGAGDELLVQIGNFFKKNIRTSDVACRYGGEEFTLFLPEASSENMIARAEVLRENIRSLKVHYHGKLLDSITISVGVSIYPEHGSTPEELIRKADSALYKAKKEGRNRVVIA